MARLSSALHSVYNGLHGDGHLFHKATSQQDRADRAEGLEKAVRADKGHVFVARSNSTSKSRRSGEGWQLRQTGT